jgi:hypothetical protein
MEIQIKNLIEQLKEYYYKQGFSKKISYFSIILVVSVFSILLLVQTIFKNPMDIEITSKNYDSIVEKIRKHSSKADYEKAQAIISLSKFASLAGKEPINRLEGKSFNQLATEMKEKAQKEQEESLQKAAIENEKLNIRKSVLNSIKWQKENRSDYYTNYVFIGVTLKNFKNKNIDAFEAEIGVYDKLKNKLATLYMKSTDKLPKNSTQVFSKGYSTIDFSNNIQEIYNTKSQDLYFEFKPTKILFTDGSEI